MITRTLFLTLCAVTAQAGEFRHYPTPILEASVYSVATVHPELAKAYGSGVMLDDKTMLTVEHNLSSFKDIGNIDSSSVDVWLGWKKFAHGPIIIKSNKLHDIALLKMPENQRMERIIKPVKVPQKFTAKPGDTLYLVGVMSGICSMKVTYVSDEAPMFLGEAESNVCSQSGDSGGAIMNENGELLGINEGSGRWKGRPQVVGIRNDYIYDFLYEGASPKKYPGTAKDFGTNFLWGFVAYLGGEYELSRKFHEAAVRIEPDNALAHDELARAYSALKMDEKAIEHYKKSIALEPNIAESYAGLATKLTQKGNWEEALINYEKGRELDPKNPLYSYDIAVAYENLKRSEDALKAYKKAFAGMEMTNPYFANTYYGIAAALGMLGRYKEAWEVVHEWQDSGFKGKNLTEMINWLSQKSSEPKRKK